MVKYFRVKITIQDVNPPIWREVILKSDYTMSDFHKIIQTVMGWSNSHLHQFVYNDEFYCDPEFEDEWSEGNCIDYTDIKLSDLIQYENQNMVYEYDFGDGWEHLIVFEEILDKEGEYPECIGGERRAPPEDCGGPPGYEHLLKILKNPNHEEYENITKWVGNSFNPEEFDKNDINEALKQEDFGSLS